MISYYLQTSGKLLDGIRSTSKSVNKSSDTPEVDGDWDTDAQLSAIAASSTETVSDSASLIDQLDAIRKKYTDLFEGWADLFRAKFTQEMH